MTHPSTARSAPDVRITIDLTNGDKVVAEPSLADLKAVGPAITLQLTDTADPMQSMLAAATLAHTALVSSATPGIPDDLDAFLATCSIEPPTLDGMDQGVDRTDPTGAASQA